MNINVLVVGCNEVTEKVLALATCFPDVSLIPLTDLSTLENVSNYQAILLANPIIPSHTLSKAMDHTPVFTLSYTEIALYSTLFKCSYEQRLTPSNSYSISIDVKDMDLKSIAEELKDERILITEYKEESRDQILKRHIDLWKNQEAQCIVTCDPYIKTRLEKQRIPVRLIIPTSQCITRSINHLIKEIPEYSKSRKLYVSDTIRYEHQGTFSSIKGLGVSAKTLHRLQCLCYANGKNTLTAAELAKGFSVTLRSARRILSNLEENQIAIVIGEEQSNQRGRPRMIFRIDLHQCQEEILSNCSYLS
ncbi:MULTISPECIES: hypothetical protein [Pontibacillus]|uniref:Transcriptional regulator n=1 Tax=Pontibacillus chungwhensis TaxID=265426 RepID=A0ABY8UU05_9BACI|nr:MULTISPECIES: hypothetical protein [Pontibacillus]MCD5322843.1 hypothetical protein [Pontibacillus sp. HN14]WIF96241.1 hypothetical protein QNI29_10775 [Pontibacillus chungwhensis]